MTYEERQKWICNDCGKDNCFYVNSSLESKCPFLDTVMYGWEFGYNDAIDKVCNFNMPDDFESHLKKAMEEQQ